ncbi:MBOAT family protein [Robertkochia marina]|uniref:MBOAT family protein n=1 Tax=Robertkochia marina TaxID=1227945 RepID=A0A4V3UY04_9FLAO|nr:MBOAT family O-acyltransferase [Robertkochia marina]THD66764.1 MBOAT family protein [Robertkochia marina]TRZ42347.1 MBOAT family protein [Robertkochia marina]
MLFNSLEYFVFLPLVFFLYWKVLGNKLTGQNILLLVSSYVFYGWWDWRFLLLILASTLVDFYAGQRIGRAIQGSRTAQRWLWVSILFNIGMLGFFKYFNFFIGSFIDSLDVIGYKVQSIWTLNIILPVGISFYTFQTLSYSLDIYRGKVKPTRNFIDFAAFVSFFPQLVAGPIERSSHLLPQIEKPRKFSYNNSADGLKLLLYGLLKKVVIADSLAPIVDDIFTNHLSYSPAILLMGAVFFGFQIYGDFSGYSDMAIGTAKLFGIELRSNFRFPYFSRNIGEFWRRWHISLSTWFRDYLYIPLGGSRVAKPKALRNIFIIFLVSGLWHGANWTFLVWGGIHAFLFVPLFVLGANRKYKGKHLGEGRILPGIRESLAVLVTFIMVSLSWIFFRAESLSAAWNYFKGLFSTWEFPAYLHPQGYRMSDYFILLLVFLTYEYRIRFNERDPFPFKTGTIRFISYALMVFALLLFYDSGTDRSFIYFQF